jgi:hypothetical protein
MNDVNEPTVAIKKKSPCKKENRDEQQAPVLLARSN